MRKKQNDNLSSETLVSAVIESMHELKANNVVSLCLTKQDTAICDYFVICDAQTDRQVESIAGNIQKNLSKDLKVKVLHAEGYENAHWVLLDYGDIVVHVFQSEHRDFYRLEDLWADAEKKVYGDERVSQ